MATDNKEKRLPPWQPMLYEKKAIVQWYSILTFVLRQSLSRSWYHIWSATLTYLVMTFLKERSDVLFYSAVKQLNWSGEVQSHKKRESVFIQIITTIKRKKREKHYSLFILHRKSQSFKPKNEIHWSGVNLWWCKYASVNHVTHPSVSLFYFQEKTARWGAPNIFLKAINTVFVFFFFNFLCCKSSFILFLKLCTTNVHFISPYKQ